MEILLYLTLHIISVYLMFHTGAINFNHLINAMLIKAFDYEVVVLVFSPINVCKNYLKLCKYLIFHHMFDSFNIY
jgi:hypothetical protein